MSVICTVSDGQMDILDHGSVGLRYPSNATEVERSLAVPFVPPARREGRPWTANTRVFLNAMPSVGASGCPPRLLGKFSPPVQTVRCHAGSFKAINTVLLMNLCEVEAREASTNAGVIDSQSAKTTKRGGISGSDAISQIKGTNGTC